MILSVVFLFIILGDYNNYCIASEASDIKPNVVKFVKTTQYSNIEQTIDNCSPGKITHTISMSTYEDTSVKFSDTKSGGGSVGVEIPKIVKAGLEGEIKKGYENLFKQTAKEEQKFTKEILPWQIMKIKVKLEKKIYESEATYKKGKKTYKVPYQYIIQVPVPTKVSFSNVKCSGQPRAVDITPDYRKLEIGATFQLKAELLDTDNKVLSQNKFVWKSSNPSIANVSRDGKVTARSEGNTKITATSQNISGEASISVKQVIRRVTIKPSKETVRYGENINLEPFVSGSNDTRLDRSVKWSSDNEEIVSISSKGIAEGRWLGTATITATCEGIKGNAQITVSPPEIPYPEYNIRLIVPFGVGSKSDNFGRIISSQIQKQILKSGVQIVVVNKPGSGGRPGWQKALSYNNDGYTLAIYNNNLRLVGSPGLDDFRPIAMCAKSEKSKYGVLAPKGTPGKFIAVLEHAIEKAVNSKSYKKLIEKFGMTPYFVRSINFEKEVNK